MVWIPCMAWKATVWIKNQRFLASHIGELGELDEDRQELDELEEQLGEYVEYCLELGESVLGLGESGRRTSTFSS